MMDSLGLVKKSTKKAWAMALIPEFHQVNFYIK